MSDKKRWPRAQALILAQELVEQLRPSCHRIEIAGSIRRLKPMVGDIEILFIPKIELRSDPNDLFADMTVNLAGEIIKGWLQDGTIQRRSSTSGVFTWGGLNKLAVHAASGIPVDFFSEPYEADWGRSLAIRTGPAEFNIRLMTSAQERGLKAHAYGPGLTTVEGWPIATHSEREFIERCGVPYAEPEHRI